MKSIGKSAWGTLRVAYSKAVPEKSKHHVLKAKGLGIEDLLRHGGLSNSKQVPKHHQDALQYYLSATRSEGEHPGDDDVPVTAYQVLLSFQTVHCPTSAQRRTFEGRADQASKDCPHLCPIARASGATHMKIMRAAANVFFERNRAWLLSPGVRSIGLAEDGVLRNGCLAGFYFFSTIATC